LVSQGQTKLGFAFLVSFAISLWSANAGMKSMFDALNIVNKEREKRGFIKLNLVALALTVDAILFVLVANPNHEANNCSDGAIGPIIASTVFRVPGEQDRDDNPGHRRERAAPGNPPPLGLRAARSIAVESRNYRAA
jgi:hypothetical protein